MADSRAHSLISAVVEAASAVLFLAWVAGRMVEDRWTWSQWLSWIPAVAVLALGALAASVAASRLRATGRLRIGSQCAVVICAVATMLRTDVGIPLGGARYAPDGVRLLQWNTSWPAGDDPASMEALARNPADIVLISNRGAITSPDQVRRWAGSDARVVGVGPFALVTRMRVLEAIPIAGGGGAGARWWVARFEVLPDSWSGRPLRIAMVDLPSRPSLSRSAVAEALRLACETGSLGEVDVVAGDFNATDGSVILGRCFPGFRDAMVESGRGWLGTWPRRFPLWRIDHVLLAPGVEADRGRVIDPGIGNHRMTEAWIRPRAVAASASVSPG